MTDNDHVRLVIIKELVAIQGQMMAAGVKLNALTSEMTAGTADRAIIAALIEEADNVLTGLNVRFHDLAEQLKMLQ